jgi:ATP-dependent exoDNAse (exonuclease V) beta subunit
VQSPARGCPLFTSRDSVLKRPDNDPATTLTVCPGEHPIGGDDGFRVAWWAPDALSLDAKAPFGLRSGDLIVKDVPPATLRKHLETYEAWRASREAAIAAASRPSVEVLTATEWSLESGSSPDIDVSVESAADGVARPGGVRFGSLVHALLADLPLDAVDDQLVSRLAAAHGRVLGADAAEIAAATAIVRGVMAHAILRAAADAARDGRCYRETPVTWRLENGRVVEGNVDLAFVAGDDVVVVDFKTDRELEGAIDRYRRQVQLYAAAIGAALGKPARGVLMRV